ncbi:MAG: glycosyltransferase family 39 protein [Synergistaceae bacterium]|nr:glycosyltransferase family 39 protein [Synergistaceae bacterium]
MLSTRKTAVLIFIALSYLFFRGIGDHGLLDPLEGVNASIALNMATRKDFVVPRVESFHYLGTALGFWWLSALSLWIFGWLDFSMRFWPVIGGLGMTAASWFIMRRTCGDRAANYAAVMTGTSLLTYVTSQLASPHTLYVCCTTSALAGIVYGFRDRRFFLLLHGGSLGAFIVYGPAGVILPWLSFLIYAYIADQDRFFLRALLYWPGVLATLLLGGGYVMLLHAENPTILALMRHNLPSVAFGSFSSALLVLSAGFFPWLGVFPEALRNALPNNWNFVLPVERQNVLLLVWAAVFSFFGLFSGDALLLLAPLPAFISLCASHLAKAVEKNDVRLFQRMVVVEILLFLPFLFVEVPWIYFAGGREAQSTLMSVIPWVSFCLLFLFAGWNYAKRRRPRKLMLSLCLSSLFALLPLAGVFDLLAQSASIRDIGLYLRSGSRRGDILVQYVMNHPSLHFYTTRESLLLYSSPLPGVVGQKTVDNSHLEQLWEDRKRVFLIIRRHQNFLAPLPAEVHNAHETRDLLVLSNSRD